MEAVTMATVAMTMGAQVTALAVVVATGAVVAVVVATFMVASAPTSAGTT